MANKHLQKIFRLTTRMLATCALSNMSLVEPCLASNENIDTGKESYNFYCYQCHGYAGNAATLATTFLSPVPRNFTAHSPETLARDQMIDAVTHGRPGTAMVSFSSVLSNKEIENVVDYIREYFMQGDVKDFIYHTSENGWDNHDRYSIAFPFANGELALDTPWESLTTEQQQGKKLFMQSCISCHDRATVTEQGPAWELRPLSFPRKHYDHRLGHDSISGASPYMVHEQPPDASGLTSQQQRGAQLFQDNCAFCHGADATGKNWIGSFLEPHARDLTSEDITRMHIDQLSNTIRNGLPGTSMPAWKHVLSKEQITDVISYLTRNDNSKQQEALLYAE